MDDFNCFELFLKSAAKKFNKKLAAKQKKLNELGLGISIDNLIKTSDEPVVEKKEKVEETAAVVDVEKMMESLNDSLKEEKKQVLKSPKAKKVKK